MVESVSCASACNCSAGGDYQKGHSIQGLVAAERNGRWGTAIGVPGLEALNIGGFAEVNSVSCTSAGTCAVGGDYTDEHQHRQGFVAAGRNGRWGTAIGVPGLAGQNNGEADVNSVSCVPAGNCAAGGYYTDSSGGYQGFVAAERDGRWGRAIEVPGLAALNTGGFAQVSSMSCASAGNCAAGGFYADRHGYQGFATAERNGRWRIAIHVPSPGT